MRSRQWLIASQRRDGGWGPEPAIPISTSVTSLAAIALQTSAPEHAEVSAIQWLKSQAGTHRVGLDGLRKWFLGSSQSDSSPEGWSFFPGTASWVAPTALAIVALNKALNVKKDPALAARVADGRNFLLSRRCSDGGWNHGGSLARGEGAGSYPETTGIGLLAFQRSASGDIDRALNLAQQWLVRTESVEAQSWIRIALSAHGRLPPGPDNLASRCRSNYDRALCLLAEASRSGTNGFAEVLA